MPTEMCGYYFDVLRYRASDKVRLMDHETRGIYREVLDEIWVTGSVPNDPEKIAKLLHIPFEAVLQAWPQISDCLIPTKHDPDRLTSERMEEERRYRNRIRLEKVKAGRASAEQRRNRCSTRVAPQLPTNGQQNSTTPTPIPIPNTEEKKKAAAPSDDRRAPFKDFMFSQLRAKGIEPITDAGTWKQFEAVLTKTRGKPEFELQKLQECFMRFVNSPDPFHQRQGDPIRYFCANVNAFQREVTHGPNSGFHNGGGNNTSTAKRGNGWAGAPRYTPTQ
jgi:hypothetical protein